MKTVIAAALLLSLSACAPDWSPVEAPKANQVRYVEFRHQLADTGALEEFLARIDAGYGDRVTIVAEPWRAEPVAARLRRLGLAPVIRNGDKPELIVGRHIVTPPACPDWTSQPQADWTNRPPSQFGCATAANLGLMVADPGDLVQGRPAPLWDGDAATLAVQRYRTGKTKALLDSNAQSQGGGATTGGAGGQ